MPNCQSLLSPLTQFLIISTLYSTFCLWICMDISQKLVTYYAALCFWLLSLSMVFSGFGHSVECFSASFLFTAE